MWVGRQVRGSVRRTEDMCSHFIRRTGQTSSHQFYFQQSECAICSNRMVNIWDASSGQILYYLPGHKGSVNEVSNNQSYFRYNIHEYTMLIKV
jgi:hypothetical protein